MCSVVRSWCKPMRLATAYYTTVNKGRQAATTADGKCLDGHKLSCTIDEHSVPYSIYPEKIGNVPASVTVIELSRACPTAFDVKVGVLSYDTSYDQSSNSIENLLQAFRTLTSFDVNDSVTPRYIKALTRFSTSKQARTAVQTLNGVSVSRLDNSINKLSCTPWPV